MTTTNTIPKLDCILLVDDDKATNFLNSFVIQRQEVARELLIAQNGRKALETIKEYYHERAHSPELVFLDINMPVMNGFEFLEAFHSLEPDYRRSVVIVVLTTSSNPKDIERMQSMGITEFINKPLSKDTLVELINKYFSDN